jgi:heme-degrading monooxygenase HmoA
VCCDVAALDDVTDARAWRNRAMVIVLIRTKLRDGCDQAAHDALNERMYEIAQGMPGFLGGTGYASADGDEVGMFRFESLEALRGWREHPEHVVAQARGRSEFFASYSVEVCQVVRAYDFTYPATSATLR